MNTFRKDFKFFWTALIILASVGVASITSAASLKIGNVQARAGQTEVPVDVEIDVSGGKAIASLQFDFKWDDRLELVEVYAGSVASAADKSVAWVSRGNGTRRVLLYGLNQNIIENGQVFQLIFDVKTGALSGRSDISAENPVASNPLGDNVSLSVQSGYVEISDSAEPPPAAAGGGGGGG